MRILVCLNDRKFGNEIVPPTSSNESTLPLHQRTATEVCDQNVFLFNLIIFFTKLTGHSTVPKSNETLARTIKPPVTDNKSDRENKVNKSLIFIIS
jgi:hypothetical protein